MLDRPTEAQIEVACEFWAEKLGKFKAFFQTDEERCNPANRNISYGEIAATVIGGEHAKKKATLNAKECLKEEIRKYLRNKGFDTDEWGEKPYGISLAVDYDPTYDFFDIVKRAGLDPHGFLFPLKTSLVIYADGEVSAREDGKRRVLLKRR